MSRGSRGVVRTWLVRSSGGIGVVGGVGYGVAG